MHLVIASYAVCIKLQRSSTWRKEKIDYATIQASACKLPICTPLLTAIELLTIVSFTQEKGDQSMTVHYLSSAHYTVEFFILAVTVIRAGKMSIAALCLSMVDPSTIGVAHTVT